ncbi:MAG: GC-type dockerin domain-anchored protein [Phycisphaerales bacterium]
MRFQATVSAMAAAAGLAVAPSALGQSFPSEFELSSLDGTNGFKFAGSTAGELVGRAVANVGDVNGDGIDDVAFGAVGASPGGVRNAGVAYVRFGDSDGYPPVVNASDIDGSNGIVIQGGGEDHYLGVAVAGAGDVNGDGRDDIFVGASGVPYDGRAFAGAGYVIFGSDSLPPIINVNDLDGTNGFAFRGTTGGAFTGVAVAGGGDIDGDDNDDIIIGSPLASAAYIIFGRDSSDPFPASMTSDDLDGTNGSRCVGIPGTRAGESIAILEDTNGDDLDELAVGAITATFDGKTSSGALYIYLGRPRAEIDADIPLEWTTPGMRIFAGGAALDSVGSGVGSAGDANNDGLGDIVVTARGSGATHLILGDPDLPIMFTPLDLDGENGGTFLGAGSSDRFGPAIGVGDINGDDRDDFISGAAFASGTGTGYVGFGMDRFAVTVSWEDLPAEEGFAIRGEASGDLAAMSIGGGGDVNADGDPDILIGSPDHDPFGRNSAGAAYVMYGGPPESDPCPADIDGDGLLTIFDFLTFGTLFDAGDPLADFDGDGELTFFDFLDFQTAFGEGCP